MVRLLLAMFFVCVASGNGWAADELPTDPQIAGSFLWVGANGWRTIATAVVALVALATLPFTAWQVWHTRKQSRALILLNLADRWDGSSFVEPRKALKVLVDKVEGKVRAKTQGHDAASFRSQTASAFAEELKILHDNGSEDYTKLMHVLGFAESAGYISKHRHLSRDDVIGLFGGVFIGMDRVFRMHIRSVQEKPGTTGKAWSNAIWLFDHTAVVAEKMIKKKG